MNVKSKFRNIRISILNSDSKAEIRRKVFAYDTQMRSEGVNESDRKEVWSHVFEALETMSAIPGQSAAARTGIEAIKEMSKMDFQDIEEGDFSLRIYDQPAVNDPKIPLMSSTFTVVVAILDDKNSLVGTVAGIGNTIEAARKDGVDRARELINN